MVWFLTDQFNLSSGHVYFPQNSPSPLYPFLPDLITITPSTSIRTLRRTALLKRTRHRLRTTHRFILHKRATICVIFISSALQNNTPNPNKTNSKNQTHKSKPGHPAPQHPVHFPLPSAVPPSEYRNAHHIHNHPVRYPYYSSTNWALLGCCNTRL